MLKTLLIFLYVLLLTVLHTAARIQWQRCYGGSQSDACYAIGGTFDGGYILAGVTSSEYGDVTGNNGGDFGIVKTDATGSIIWEKNYGGDCSVIAHDIMQTADSRDTVVGLSRSNNSDLGTKLLQHPRIKMYYLSVN